MSAKGNFVYLEVPMKIIVSAYVADRINPDLKLHESFYDPAKGVVIMKLWDEDATRPAAGDGEKEQG